MKNVSIFILCILSYYSWSQITYPGTPNIGTPQVVFDYSSDKCTDDDLPDVPARAFRDASGKINLIASHHTNWRMIGNDFDNLSKDCNPVLESDLDENPANFNDKEWIVSTYTNDGINIHALLHNEYVPCGNWNNCWYNAITYAFSSDSGKTYTHTDAPNHLVASSPYQSPYPSNHSPFGLFGGSNIIEKDGYYYKLVQIESYGEQQWGTGILRTNNLADPRSWRGWNGEDYSVEFVNPYTENGFIVSEKILAPLSRDNIGKMCASLTFNTYFNKFMVVDYTLGEINGQLKYGFYYSLSDDLIHWTKKRIIYQFNSSTWAAGGNNYPSIIDHNDESLNFERPGQTCYLYYTKWNSGLDRDLMRIAVTFNKEIVTAFTINSINNGGDATPGDGICKTTGNVCTIRAAIEEANARPPYDGFDTLPLQINFGISGTGVKTIQPASTLPEIMYPLYINGYTQNGASANTNNFDTELNTVINIVLDGEDGGAHTLAFQCGNNTVKGLSLINGNLEFLYEEGYSTSKNNNIIEGCFVGMSANGTTPYNSAIYINNQDSNLIGGTNNAERNLIGNGVILTKSSYNKIEGNFIGSDFSGMQSSGTGAHGIELNDSCTFNSIGGANNNQTNLISGGNRGIQFFGINTHNNSIFNNYIGVANDGFSALGNNGAGILLSNQTHNNYIGEVNMGNVIADNSNEEAGIWIDNANNNVFKSNFIGTDKSTTAQLGNGAAGNFCGGIILNGQQTFNNTFGGLNANEGNVIANNYGYGIGTFEDVGEGNTFLSNLIYNSEKMGIDLYADDIANDNDDMDLDNGQNGGQNFPVLFGAYIQGSETNITGTFNSKPNQTYTLQFFYNQNCDASGHGEAENLIGTTTVLTNEEGNASLMLTFENVVIPEGAFVTSLATDENNSTSEFSVCIESEIDITTPVSQINDFFVKIYPTITTESFTIHTQELVNFDIIDINGKIVNSAKTTSNLFRVDIQNITKGIYIVKLIGENTIYHQKIIKQ